VAEANLFSRRIEDLRRLDNLVPEASAELPRRPQNHPQPDDSLNSNSIAARANRATLACGSNFKEIRVTTERSGPDRIRLDVGELQDFRGLRVEGDHPIAMGRLLRRAVRGAPARVPASAPSRGD
jgi:hypothetical protein